MNEFQWWQVAVVGPLVGFVGMLGGGYWGVGCGWIVVPIMLILGFDPLTAVGIGLLQMVPSTILTVAKQAPEIGWKRGEVGRVLALPVMAGALITSLAGRFINEALKNRFDAAPLQWMSIVFISFIAFQTLCSRTACYNDAMPELTPRKSAIGFAAGMVTGLVSSLLGVGGGIVIRPLLTSGFKVPEFYTSRIVRLMVLAGLLVLDELLQTGQGTERVDDDLAGIGVGAQEQLALRDVTGVVRDGVRDVAVVQSGNGDDGDGAIRRQLHGLFVDLGKVRIQGARH